jgi:hypothetical protein
MLSQLWVADMVDQFTDSGLIEQARLGNLEAIQEVCNIAFKNYSETGRLTDKCVISFLMDALNKIANGDSPNEAFGWNQRKGRRNQEHNLQFRDWNIRMLVRDYMREGLTRSRAIDLYLKRCDLTNYALMEEEGLTKVEADSYIKFYKKFQLGRKSIEKICKGLSSDTDLPFPENPFPIVIKRF